MEMPAKQLMEYFNETRKKTEYICSFLKTEDYVIQPVIEVSPPKWHLAHTSWFFEEFILKNHKKNYQIFSKDFAFIFNSYYDSLGEKIDRSKRGNLSRPTVNEIYEYRKHVSEEVMDFLYSGFPKDLEEVLMVGIHHEKQHQELLLTDIKYILGNNPLFPLYNEEFRENPIQENKTEWIDFNEGIYEIGHKGEKEFCYDNELGAHKVYLAGFSISSNLVINKEYLEFMESEAYDDVTLWHMEGWQWKKQHNIKAPFYWHRLKNEWYQYTLNGLQKINLNAPLAHISYYEASAFSKWKEMRLPTEFEWEAAHKQLNYGSRWEWTESAYLPYPGYKKADGAIGEYNGKFMINQMVLRGGSVASAEKHLRPTYRNFFHANERWQFTGIRLAK